MTDRTQITDEELQAFIDGELDKGRTSEIADRIESDPDLAAMVEAFQNDKQRLIAHYEPLLALPLPPQWSARIARARRSRNFVRPLMALAASVVVLVASWATYQFVLPDAGEAAVTAAIAARADSLIDPRGSTANAAVVSAALGMSLKLPNLSAVGYTLATVKIYPGARGNAVRMDYRKGEDVFTLYLRPSSGRERFDLTKRGDLRICLWQDDVLSTVMVGRMSAAEMLRLASLAYDGLYF